jgi:hypothetical protein
MREMPMGDAQVVGDYLAVPVELQHEHGITYAAPRTGPTTLLASNAAQSEQALVEGYQIFGRARVDYEAMAKASSAGEKAFMAATRLIVKRLTKSGGKRAPSAWWPARAPHAPGRSRMRPGSRLPGLAAGT